jgi:hypothetical protein
MALPSNAPAYVPPLTMSSNSLEVLERLRESYEGRLAQAALTETDHAVLIAVEITLKHARKALRPA